MEHLDYFLEKLVSHNGEALCLEPNKNPYVRTEDKGNIDLTKAPMQLAQINSMVFELMPDNVKQELPNRDEVNFTHTRGLDSFNFAVKKSATGFSVVVNSFDSAEAEPNGSSVTPADVIEEEPPVSNEEETPMEQNSPEPISPVSEPVPNQQVTANATPADNLSPLEKLKLTLSAKAQPAAQAENAPAPEAEDSPTASAAVSTPVAESMPAVDVAPPPAPEPIIEVISPPTPEPVFEPAAASEPIIEVISPPTPAPVFEPAPPPMSTPVAPPPTPAVVKAAANPKAKAQMDALFSKMSETGASDLHMSVSAPPMVRKDGKMAVLEDGQHALTPDSVKELLNSIMPQTNIEEFAERNDTDFAYEIKGLARFRANIFMDRKGMGGVFRIIPSDIMTAEDLSLSKHIMDLCDLSKGLVVVTGPTGSGKSTTLCAMVDSINKNREDHIITIEDPIEFTHENQKCLVNQREVHNHTDSFKDALRAALREDPDILLVGEMRDLETVSIAIETAETGHLVFGTLHTTTAASTVDRIIDQFPADRQQQVRVMLSESLRGVIAQTLLPKIGGGRVAALEVLIVTPAISNLIREGKTFQIPSAMQTGKAKGMVMLNDALMELVNKGLVEPKHAYIKAVDKASFEMLLTRAGKKI